LPQNILVKIKLKKNRLMLFVLVHNQLFQLNFKTLGIGLQKVMVLLFKGAVTPVRNQGDTCKGSYAIATV
jgi:hypothetical protein